MFKFLFGAGWVGDSDDGDNDDGDDSDNDVGAPIIQLHITAAHHVCPLRSGHGGSARNVYDDTHGESSRTDRVITTTRRCHRWCKSSRSEVLDPARAVTRAWSVAAAEK